MDQPNTSPSPSETLKPMDLPKKKMPKEHIICFVLVALLVVALGVLGWLWWTANGENTQLKSQNADLQSQLNDLKAKDDGAAEPGEEAAKPCDGTITASLKDNVSAAVSSGNTAALEGYMANPVTVIIAASEGVGPRTPAQAVADMAYLSGATAPWDFNLDAGTIATYEAGFYKDYFNDRTFAGRAAGDNKMVVVFEFNDCAKIKTVFMAASEDLLLN